MDSEVHLCPPDNIPSFNMTPSLNDKCKSKTVSVKSSRSRHRIIPSDPLFAKIIDLPKLKDNGKCENSSDSSSGNRRIFVPTDPHMARVLDLLKVDLDAIDDEVKPKKGLAKVDRKWFSNLDAIAWSHAFNEEGHLRITRIMFMLPELVNRPNVHNSLWKSYRRLESAALGLSFYNKRNEGAEYYLVKPINFLTSLRNKEYVSHANFLAKRKDDPESPAELFFAEVSNIYNEVTVCYPVEHHLFPPDITPPLENAIFDRARVIHPEGFECFTCNHKSDTKMLWHKVKCILSSTMNPEISDRRLDNMTSLTRRSQWEDNGQNKNAADNINYKCRFVPHDPYMAKILKLLNVDLDAIDNNVKLKKGFAKVDKKWISKLCAVACKDAFDEEGHLRLTRIFHILPKLVNLSDAHISLWRSYRRLESAALGLADYNIRNEGAEFYLFMPINAHPVPRRSSFVSHANFLAKRKGDLESPVKLFFAEVFYGYDEVTICCPLEPNLLLLDIVPPLEEAKFHRAVVIHPEGFECLTCNSKCRCV